jgi:hypothetical protein
MEKFDKNVKIKNNKPATNTTLQSLPYLFNNLTKLDNSQSLILLDFYHLTLENEEEYQFIQKHLLFLKEVCFLDTNVNYLIFTKQHILEQDEDSVSTQKMSSHCSVRNFIIEILNQNKNIFIEYKQSHIDFITGFLLAKKTTVYIFTDENSKNSKWLKMGDSSLDDKIKFSEFEYLRVTMDYMLRDKKRNIDNKNKQPSKLTAFFEGKNEPQNNVATNKLSQQKINNTGKIHHVNITQLPKFQQLIENVIQYMTKSPPKSFKVIKNIITNFAEQHSNFFFKNYSLGEDSLSFMIFSELINREVILNRVLKNLITEKVITNLDEIETMLCFFINPDYEEDLNFEEDLQVNFNDINNQELITGKKSKRKKNDPTIMNFSISENAEEEYKKLILTCPPICNYIRKMIYKILCNCSISSIDKLPTNPGRYKNFILSYVNNQELFKISKKILNLDYDKIVNILTEGIIIEFMRNGLVIFITEKKIHYNLPEIEKERFRLSQIEEGK